MNRSFTCKGCGKTFGTDTYPATIKEYLDLYGYSQADSEEGNVFVCDKCWDKLLMGGKQS
jgi:hypothetical protein